MAAQVDLNDGQGTFGSTETALFNLEVADAAYQQGIALSYANTTQLFANRAVALNAFQALVAALT